LYRSDNVNKEKILFAIKWSEENKNTQTNIANATNTVGKTTAVIM